MNYKLTGLLLVLALGLSSPRGEAQSLSMAAPLARVLPKPLRDYPASPILVEGSPQEAPVKILEAALRTEALQRGFYPEVPRYRVEFAWHSILEAFSISGSTPYAYEELKRRLRKPSGQGSLYFNLDWQVQPRSAEGWEAERRVRDSGSEWGASLLQWEKLPQSVEEFNQSLERQLNEQYQAVTRRRVIEETVSQALPECLQVAMRPSPRVLRLEYDQNLQDWRRQQTQIGFGVWRGKERVLRKFLRAAERIQKAALSQMKSKGPVTRASLQEARKGLLTELQSLQRSQFPALTWQDSQILWPTLGEAYPAKTAGLKEAQLSYALQAPLGKTLLPNTLESLEGGQGEIWVVMGEWRDPPVTLSFADPQVQAILINRLKSQAYIQCAIRWFLSELGQFVLLEPGVVVSQAQWAQAFQSLMDGGGAH